MKKMSKAYREDLESYMSDDDHLYELRVTMRFVSKKGFTQVMDEARAMVDNARLGYRLPSGIDLKDTTTFKPGKKP